MSTTIEPTIATIMLPKLRPVTPLLQSDVRCCIFYGDAHRRTTSFAAARTLVADMLGASSLSKDDHFRGALSELGVEASDRKTLQTLFIVGKSGSRQRLSDNTQTQINAFVTLALSRPTLLLIEDLQWIDPESRHFLKLLARASTPQPLCILLTGRPESSFPAADIVDSIVHLQPLSPTNMEALGHQLWPKDRSPAVLARAIDRADGVPFILEEFLRSADATNIGRCQKRIHARFGTGRLHATCIGRQCQLRCQLAQIDAQLC